MLPRLPSEQLNELERLTRGMAESSDWSYYHRMDEQFHQLLGTASCPDTADEVFHDPPPELYDYFIPYPIDKLHTSNRDHIALVAALRAPKRGGSGGGFPGACGHPAPDDVYGAGGGLNAISHIWMNGAASIV